MRWLLRVYPRSWRERYGAEMEALLDERGVAPRDLIDLARGALDAHRFMRGAVAGGQAARDTPLPVLRLLLAAAGTALMVGAGSYIALTSHPAVSPAVANPWAASLTAAICGASAGIALLVFELARVGLGLLRDIRDDLAEA